MRASIEPWLATSLAVFTGFASVTFTPSFAQTETESTQSPAVATGPVSTGLQLSYSPGLRDILKMLDAKVDVEVIKAYIKSAPIAFSPSASEIIALKQHNV